MGQYQKTPSVDGIFWLFGCIDDVCECGGLESTIEATSLLGRELDDSCDRGKESIIASATNVLSRVNRRAALTDENLSGTHSFSITDLRPEILRVGISTESGGATRLFVCHKAKTSVLPP